MDRVAVVGPSGAGKSTVARAMSAAVGLPHIELDAVFHQEAWTPLPEADLRAHVAAVVAGDGWVVDGNYPAVRDLVWERATAVVWLDLPRPAVTWRVARRSLRRTVTRAELWNGNREVWHEVFRLWDPELSPIANTWHRHASNRLQVAQVAAEHPHVEVVRLRSRAEVRRWLAQAGIWPVDVRRAGAGGPRSRGRGG